MVQNARSSPKSSSDPRQRFRELALRYADLMRAEGIGVVPYASAELPVFSALGSDAQRAALGFLESTLECFDEVRAEGASLRDTPRLLWRSLRRLGLVPQGDIFDKIEDGDVVEIYSLDQRHLFWNLRMMEIVSFTVEQLYSIEWWKMTRRDPAVTQKLHEIALKLISGEIAHTLDPGIGEHRIDEVDSPGLHRFETRIKYLSPARGSSGELAAVIVVNRSRLIPA